MSATDTIFGQWNYQFDSETSALSNDAVQDDAVGGNDYEIYGAAFKETADRIFVAVTSNTPLGGIDDVEWGDAFFNFTNANLDTANARNALTAVRFAGSNEAKVSGTGVFQDVTAVSVAPGNGLDLNNIQKYINYVNENGGSHSFGALSADTGYFNRNQHLPNVINSGRQVGGVALHDLNASALGELNFGAVTGSHTFGFSFDKSLLPEGEFVMHLAPECANDIITIHETIGTPSLDIEKLTNGVDGDRPEDAVGIRPSDEVVWTYKVTNTGTIAVPGSEIEVVDDKEGIPTFDLSSDDGGDGILSPNEEWMYTIRGIAENLNYSIDFDTNPATGDPLPAGTIIKDLYTSEYGLTISTEITQEEGGPITDWGAMIFDSGNPTGDSKDRDLGTPNRANGGPGSSDKDQDIAAATNTESLSNVLILPERLLEPDDPFGPDDNALGGTFRLDWVEPVQLNSIGLLDITDDNSYIELYDAAGNLLKTIDIDGLGANTYQEEDLEGVKASRMDVVFVEESAAIASVDFSKDYINNSTVRMPNVPGVGDGDPSTYTSPNPGIDIEKSTNHIDADTADTAAVIAPGQPITWRYHVTNTGNVPFHYKDIIMTDDQGLIPMLDATTDAGGDRILLPGETWMYTAFGITADLATQSDTVVLDFETNGAGDALTSGNVIDNEFQDAYGLTISAPGHPYGTMIFDTANIKRSDKDLRTPGAGEEFDAADFGPDNTRPLGNVLILSEDGNSEIPDDDKFGGTFQFEWDEAVQVHSIDVMDIEEPGSQVITYDVSGSVVGTYDIAALGNNSVQTVPFQNEWITRMDVVFDSIESPLASGAIAAVEFTPLSTYKNLGTVNINGWEGVTDSDWSHYRNSETVAPVMTSLPPIISVTEGNLQRPTPSSTSPGKRVVSAGQMLRGTQASDSISGLSGDDTIRGLLGDDWLNGRQGNDLLRGGRGHDRLRGNRGRDTLVGGAGDDLISGGRGHDRISGGIGADVILVRQGRDRITTGNGEDVIAIDDNGFAIIEDFKLGEDSLQLLGSRSALETADLTFVNRGDDLLVKAGEDKIARLINVDF